ncbi:single-stranded DNA-binding protein [Metaclostridioides mangenotii]|uniref:Single-stranded DNA-binding protein n=1 Tax=Metaclostridioides mangenotii TaxID=1540 RepID=A0ABS4E9Q3_9FIRM|nr:single-stranded DNA-binding protein [Clostridioides mangenotii]MBP1854673.1 single-strand DNA-binding protein [Clostridioides mangenotii]
MNNITLVGRLTRDPELKYFQSGTAKLTFSIAVDRDYKTKDGNKLTDYIPVEALGKSAETWSNYLGKGRQVGIQGSMYVDRYTDESGNNRTFTKVHAKNVEFLDSGKDKTSNEPQFEPQGLDPQGFQAIDDDDIPF